MKVHVWGARGSVPAPGPETNRYGGNTSCLQVTLSDGSVIVLDAGTGIRSMGVGWDGPEQINILLTHLHLDHIQGLMFFAPAFSPGSEITVWGPESPEASLEDRIARYISAPLSPVEVRELPCDVSFRDAPDAGVGDRARRRSRRRRSPTAAPRSATASPRATRRLCYIPDHEPALGADLDELEPEWISGYGLARDADLLMHDCQYTDAEYPDHVGWGHSAMSDSLCFARRVNARRTLLFHHDPLHSDDQLDRMHPRGRRRWEQHGRRPGGARDGVRAGARWRCRRRSAFSLTVFRFVVRFFALSMAVDRDLRPELAAAAQRALHRPLGLALRACSRSFTRLPAVALFLARLKR